MRHPGRVLMVHQGALGDFLLMLPAIEGLQRACPGIRIGFQAKAEHLTLISHRDYFATAHPSAAWNSLLSTKMTCGLRRPLPAPFLEQDEIFIFGQEGAASSPRDYPQGSGKRYAGSARSPHRESDPRFVSHPGSIQEHGVSSGGASVWLPTARGGKTPGGGLALRKGMGR